ncbi:hypothetical protein E3J79_03410 [Candidatus Dependentiae bacterium]|nr:MAG: hypothetical protein E3J79_03410 [Candidatus Dependentiae bacterium]
MINKFKQVANSLFEIAPHERLKVLFLSLTYFCIIAGYSVAKELKDTVFTIIVGEYYIPKVRIAAMIILVPAILFYALLVDRLRRYQLLCFYSLFYSIVGLIFTFLLSHPIIGMANTDSSPYRLFGWLFYFFLEGYTPFVVSVFWAFANSITDQEGAKKNYGLMVAGSKLGGMFGPLLAWLWLYLNSGGAVNTLARDIFNHQILLGFFSVMSLIIPLIIILLMKKVPGRYLHGYEAVYQLEKKRSQEGRGKSNVLAGFAMLLKYPYVFGIFCIIFFYEIINTVLSYQRVLIAKTYATNVVDGAFSVSAMASFLYQVVFLVHFIGFLISLFGTRLLLEMLGEKRALILVPILHVVLLIYFFGFYTPFAFITTSVLIKAINYSLSYPLRENLYIPTMKEIKFKAKSWIDSFGGKFGKATGSVFNWLAQFVGPAVSFSLHFVFFSVISGAGLLAAYLLGKKFEWSIAHNEVIGVDSQEELQE